jgi:hypothetical protein
MPLFSDVVGTFFSQIVILNPNGKFLHRATIAFSERYINVRIYIHPTLQAAATTVLMVWPRACSKCCSQMNGQSPIRGP